MARVEHVGRRREGAPVPVLVLRAGSVLREAAVDERLEAVVVRFGGRVQEVEPVADGERDGLLLGRVRPRQDGDGMPAAFVEE